MGLQKDYLKDNQEMDQMLGDLDLLQVFKHLAPNSDNLCDLAGGLSLFNDVDVMNIGLCGDDVVSAASNSSALPGHQMHHMMLAEPDTLDIRAEIKKRHTQMMRKCDFLLRRLRKLQARSMSQHVNEEVNGLFEYAQRQLKRKERETKSISTMVPAASIGGGSGTTGGGSGGGGALDKHATTATTSMKSMLSRLTTVATEQQCTAIISSERKAAEAAAKKFVPTITTGWVPTFEIAVTNQLEDSAGLLQTEMKLVANAIDSDVTASSSGGESADEMVAYNNTSQLELGM